MNRDYLRIRKSKKIVYKMYLKSNIEQVSELYFFFYFERSINLGKINFSLMSKQSFCHFLSIFLYFPLFLRREDHKRVQEETCMHSPIYTHHRM